MLHIYTLIIHWNSSQPEIIAFKLVCLLDISYKKFFEMYGYRQRDNR